MIWLTIAASVYLYLGSVVVAWDLRAGYKNGAPMMNSPFGYFIFPFLVLITIILWPLFLMYLHFIND